MMKKATAVLDFGTSKVLVLLAEESAYQKVTITSAGMAQYDGFMNGEWNAPSEVSNAIASAIEAAENKVGTHIKEVYVGVPGEFVRVYVIESSVALQGADPKVTSADVENCKDRRPKCSTARRVLLSTVLRHGSRWTAVRKRLSRSIRRARRWKA